MRIPAWCHECVSDGELGERAPANEDVHLIDVEEDNAYVGRCKNGHVIKFTLQTMRFELLFESGIVAMLAGFHREAISSIAAAVERFYEFSIESFIEKAGVRAEDLETAWKQVATQSERQFGAYVFLYLTTFRKPLLATKEERKAFQEWTEFRNGVIHKGHFPTRTRALGYAKFVFEMLRDRMAELREHDPDIYQRVQWRYTMRSHEAAEQKLKVVEPEPMPDKDGLYRGIGGASYATMLSPGWRGAPMDFEARLDVTKDNLWIWGVRRREDIDGRATPPE